MTGLIISTALDFLSPELGPLVSSGGECEGSNLQLLDVHGQDVCRWQRRSPPRVFAPHQAQIVTLQKHLRRKQFSLRGNY